MCIMLDGTEFEIPAAARLVSDNRISLVYEHGDVFYKRSIPYLINNEYYAIKAMEAVNAFFTPHCERLDKATLRFERILTARIEPRDTERIKQSAASFMRCLAEAGLRHGDLTPPHVLWDGYGLVVIDWAESRWAADPAPDKRPEGDPYWMEKTLKEKLNGTA